MANLDFGVEGAHLSVTGQDIISQWQYGRCIDLRRLYRGKLQIIDSCKHLRLRKRPA